MPFLKLSKTSKGSNKQKKFNSSNSNKYLDKIYDGVAFSFAAASLIMAYSAPKSVKRFNLGDDYFHSNKEQSQ